MGHEPVDSRAESNLEFPAQERIKRFLILLFLAKPTIDLLWAFSTPLAGFRVGPLQIAGLIVFLYLFFALISTPKLKTPNLGLLIVFVILNFMSAIFGFIFHNYFNIQGVLNLFFRIMDSILIYGAAFAVGRRNRISDWEDIVKAIVIGVGIAIILNQFAIATGFGGGMKVGAASALSDLRERGLYYDPGGLAIIALYGFIFISYALKHLKLKLTVLAVSAAGLLCSLGLIVAGNSRSVYLLVSFYLVGFVLGFGKLGQKALYGLALAAIVFLVGSYALVNHERLTARFEGDVAAVNNLTEDFAEGKEISEDDLAALGSNRGRNWIISLEWIMQRDLIEFMFGNFISTPAHSDYLDVLSRNGLIGLILYLFILASFLLKTFKGAMTNQPREVHSIHMLAFLLLAIYLLYSIPFRPLSYTTTAWYMWATIGFSMAYLRAAALENRADKLRALRSKLQKVESVPDGRRRIRYP